MYRYPWLALPLLILSFIGPSRAATDMPLRFFAVGDLPYNQAERQQLRELFEMAVAERTPFLVHVGDLKAGSQPCTDEHLERIAALFRDQPVPVLDVSVQAAILNLLVELQKNSKTAYMFISHDLSVVRYLSDQVAVMYMGKLCEIGTPEEVFVPPYHPYTEALLSAISLPDPLIKQETIRLEGSVPSPVNPEPGCRFASRCPRKIGKVCETEDPPLHEFGKNHRLYCHISRNKLEKMKPVITYAGKKQAVV